MPRKTQTPARDVAVEVEPIAVEETAPVETPEAKPARKAKLTLSQRRALLRLQDAMPQSIHPESSFRALPFEYLASVGLAEIGETGGVALTEAGIARAAEINPGYLDWRAGGSVKGGTFVPDVPKPGTAAKTAATARAVEEARIEALTMSSAMWGAR